MLAQLSSWVKGVLIAGMAAGLLKTLIPSGVLSRVFSFVAALAVALAFISPLAAARWNLSPGRLLDMAADALTAAEDENAVDRSAVIIKTGLAAYISKRAEELGLRADVTVTAQNIGGGQYGVTGVDVAYRIKPSGEDVAALADDIEQRYGVKKELQRHRYGRQNIF